MTDQKKKSVPWYLWPFWVIWEFIAMIVGMTGRIIAVVLGFVLMVVGVILSVTVVGLIVGAPMIVIGLMILVRNFATGGVPVIFGREQILKRIDLIH